MRPRDSAGKRSAGDAEFEATILIACAPTRVLQAFFDPIALATWWQASRSVTTPVPLGVYAVEWDPTPHRDEVLGRFGGVFHGTVMEYAAGREFFIADAWWIPPDTDPLGPMALDVRCEMDGPACRLTVKQSGSGTGERWRRYFDAIDGGWRSSLAGLKEYVEALSVG
jgi:uncharacterized protein YndB with AHSA1/START domain